MIETVTSVNGIAIRLTDERWAHITEEHSELAGMRFEILETVAQPTKIYEGGNEELIAIREIKTGKFLAVTFREIQSDGLS